MRPHRLRFGLLASLLILLVSFIPALPTRQVAASGIYLPTDLNYYINALYNGETLVSASPIGNAPGATSDQAYQETPLANNNPPCSADHSYVLGWSSPGNPIPVTTTCPAIPYSVLRITMAASFPDGKLWNRYKFRGTVCFETPTTACSGAFDVDPSPPSSLVEYLIVPGNATKVHFTATIAIKTGGLEEFGTPSIDAHWTLTTTALSPGFTVPQDVTCAEGDVYQNGNSDKYVSVIRDFASGAVELQRGGVYRLTHQIISDANIQQVGAIIGLYHFDAYGNPLLKPDGTTSYNFASSLRTTINHLYEDDITIPNDPAYKFSRLVFSTGDLIIPHDEVYSHQKAALVDINNQGCTYDGASVNNEEKGEEDPCVTHSTDGYAGDPVNTQTGNLSHQVLDLEVPTYGLPLRFERSYNSVDATTTDGLLGPGWTHSYAMRLNFFKDRTLQLVETAGTTLIEVRAEHGSLLRFRKINGAYVANASTRATLTKQVNDGVVTYKLARCSSQVDTFNANGKLKAQDDGQGHVTTLNYLDGLLDTVVAPDGRLLNFYYTYGTPNRLSSVQVQKPGGIVLQSVSFIFSSPDNIRLTEATDVRGKTTKYTYLDPATNGLPASAGFLQKVTDPLGRRVFKVAYDGFWRVKQEWVGDAIQPMTFDYEANRTTITDAAGNLMHHYYSPHGQLTYIVQAPSTGLKAITQLSDYDAFDNPTTIIDPRGYKTRLTYDTTCGCRLTKVQERLLGVVSGQEQYGLVTDLQYNAANQLEYLTVSTKYSPSGPVTPATTHYVYSNGRLDSIYGPDSHLDAHFTYYTTDPSKPALLKEAFDARGKKTTFYYDAYDNTGTYNDTWYHVSDIVDATNQRTSFQYDDLGNVILARNARGYVTQYLRNPAGMIRNITENFQLNGPVDEQTNVTTTFTYDDAGDLETITTPPRVPGGQPVVTALVHDALGRLLDTTYNKISGVGPVGESNVTFSTRYDDAGRVTKTIDGRGKETLYGYNIRNELKTITDPLGRLQRTFTYDQNGNLLTETDNNGLVTTYTYNDQNLVSSIANGLGETTTYNYDALGRLISIADPKRTNAVQAKVRDPNAPFDEENLAATSYAGSVTAYRYDVRGRLIDVVENWQNGAERTNETNVWTHYEYDPAGNLTAVDSPRTGLEGTLAFRTNYSYTDRNELETITDPLSRIWRFHYDPNGNPDQFHSPVMGPNEVISSAYDPLDRLTSVTRPDGTSQAQYLYNPNGTRRQMVDTLGTWTYGYDPLARLTSLQDPRANVGTLTLTYNANSQRVKLSTPTKTQRQVFNDAGEITQVDDTATTVYGSYTYDAGGRLETASYINGVSASYTYRTNADQLQKVEYTRSDGTIDRLRIPSYDKNGNVKQRILATVSTADVVTQEYQEDFTYDKLNRLLSAKAKVGSGSVNTTSYTYDAAGNRTSVVAPGGTETVTYDQANAMASYQGTDVSSFVDAAGRQTQGVGPQANTLYAYDSFDRLTGITNSSGLTKPIYNGDGVLVGEQLLNGSGVVQEETTYLVDPLGLDQIVEARKTVGSTTTPTTYLWGNGRFGELSGTSKRTYGLDEQGTPRYTYGSGGIRQQQTNYTAWGQPSQTPNTAWGFTGERYDTRTGLEYLRARWYNPTTGRFLTRDPFQGFLGLPQSQNPYAYALNNPQTYTDPSGNFPPWLAAAAAGAAIGGGLELGRQMWDNHKAGRDLFHVCWGMVGMQALGGAVAGLTGYMLGPALSATFGGGFWGSVAAGALSGAIENVAAQMAMNALSGRPLSSGLLQAALSGAVAGGLGGALGYGARRLMGNVDNAASNCFRHSFRGDTEVATPEGDTPIDEIDVGNTVLAYDEASGTTGAYSVTAVHVHTDPTIVLLTIDGELIETTPAHPFYVQDQGWVDAEDLRFGDHVRNLDGDTGIVATVHVVQRAQTMYNLTVATAHTFFVGDGAWLVHNCAAGGKPRWPNTPEEMEEFLGVPGTPVPDGTAYPGRNKVVWEVSPNVKIVYEQHPYHTSAPAYHTGPHWHLDTPGADHVRYLPGEEIPGY